MRLPLNIYYATKELYDPLLLVFWLYHYIFKIDVRISIQMKNEYCMIQGYGRASVHEVIRL